TQPIRREPIEHARECIRDDLGVHLTHSTVLEFALKVPSKPVYEWSPEFSPKSSKSRLNDGSLPQYSQEVPVPGPCPKVGKVRCFDLAKVFPVCSRRLHLLEEVIDRLARQVFEDIFLVEEVVVEGAPRHPADTNDVVNGRIEVA